MGEANKNDFHSVLVNAASSVVSKFLSPWDHY